MATGAKCISRHEYPRGPCTQRSSPLLHLMVGFPGGSGGKESACNAGDLGSIPGLGRSPGEGNGYPFQYSCLENSMDCIVHRITKSWTRRSNFHFHLGIDLAESEEELKSLLMKVKVESEKVGLKLNI